jgi:phospholipid transport system transporter-binding protein
MPARRVKVSKADIRFDGGKLQVSGELTFATVSGLLGQSRSLFANAGEGIEVELSGVERADSAGLALLVAWMRLAASQGNRITFHHLPEQMRAIAAASDLDSLLPLSS